MNNKFARLIVVIVTLMLVAGMSLSVAAQGGTPRGGTVIISEGQQAPHVRNFNPYAPDPTRWTQSTMYESLMIYNPVEGGAATPWLATGYEWSDDLLSLTYTLRDDVLWSDGEPFNADDVVFTFNMIQANTAMDRGGMLAFAESVEKVDDYTVTFHLNQVYTLAAEVIGGGMWIVPEHIWSTIEDPATFTNDNPVATGMFTDVVNVNEQVLTVCRNDLYWGQGADGGQLPYVDCFQHPVFPGNDPANLAAVNGEVDWIGNFMPDIDNTYVAADPEHFFYYFWQGGGMVQYYMNTSVAPWDDVNLRRALSMAIDYQSVVDIGMYGYTDPGNPTGLGPRYASWINPEAEALAASYGQDVYNPEAAAAALDAAGYVDVNNDGWRELPNGDPFSFRIQVVNGWTDWVTSVQIMSQNFQDVGLNATIETPDYGAWIANLQQGNYDTSIGWGSAGNTAWNHFHDTMYSPLIGSDGIANGELWHRWTSPEADALIDDFVATADEAQQHADINQLQMIYVENVITIPLFPGPTWYEYNTTRFTGFPTQEDYYTQGSPWNSQGRTLTLTRLHCVDDTSCGQTE